MAKYDETMTYEGFEPYRKLAVSVLTLALLDRDRGFFRNEWSAFWCKTAGFDPDQVRPAALGYIEQRKPWPLHLIPTRYHRRCWSALSNQSEHCNSANKARLDLHEALSCMNAEI